MGEDETQLAGEWPERLARWQRQLDETGLGGLAQALAPALSLFGPIAAQLIWVAQPALTVFGWAEEAPALAHWLEQVQQRRPDR
jgi:hypothetical protein